MRLLTATARGQGTRDNDYHWCIEGELVVTGLICRTDRDDPDGGCGCGRGFSGLTSHRSTTTATVRDIPLVSPADYVAVLRMSLHDQGYIGADAEYIADELVRLAATFPDNTIVERRLDIVQTRPLPIEQQAP